MRIGEMKQLRWFWFAALCLFACERVALGDWPQFLGPARDGSAAGLVATNFPKEGPVQLWSASVGAGFAGPVVSSNAVFLFHRKSQKEIVTAFARENGKQIWENGYPATYTDDFGFDEGPRATPVLAGGKLFTYGADGVITAWQSSDGKMLWQVDAKQKFGSRKGFFGRAPSPLVIREKLVVAVGGENGASIVALNVADGATLWKAGDDEASYASPVIAKFNGGDRLLALTRERLLVLLPDTGKVEAQVKFRPSMNASVSAATPLVKGNQIFLTASYGAGAVLLNYTGGNFEKVWAADEQLSSHYSTPVVIGNLLFGFDGRQEQGADLVCVEWPTGKERWRAAGFGSGTIIRAAENLVILSEKGELVIAAGSGDRFSPMARGQVLGFDTRAHAALASGLLFARDKQKLVCLDLRPEEKTQRP